MFGIGVQELMIILVVALLVLGPARLPQVARSLARGMREFRKASDDLKQAMWTDVEDDTARAPAPRNLPPLEPVAASPVAATAGASPLDTVDVGEIPGAALASSPPGEGLQPRAETVARGEMTPAAAQSSGPEGVGGGPGGGEVVGGDGAADDHTGMPWAAEPAALVRALREAGTPEATEPSDGAAGQGRVAGTQRG